MMFAKRVSLNPTENPSMTAASTNINTLKKEQVHIEKKNTMHFETRHAETNFFTTLHIHNHRPHWDVGWSATNE